MGKTDSQVSGIAEVTWGGEILKFLFVSCHHLVCLGMSAPALCGAPKLISIFLLEL
jgi:hypothetical protein